MHAALEHKPPADCPVCLQHYSRQDRVPRLLHCSHTFCTPCLERIAVCESNVSMCTMRCPLCRWTSCLRPFQAPREGLWVNSELWDHIPDTEEEEEEEEMGTSTAKAEYLECSMSECPGLQNAPCHVKIPTNLNKNRWNLQLKNMKARVRQALPRAHLHLLCVPSTTFSSH